MAISKFNIGLAPSRNFDKVTLEMLEETIEYDSEAELKAKIRQKFQLLREEVELEFSKMNENTQWIYRRSCGSIKGTNSKREN